MGKQTVVIHGIKYEAVDKKRTGLTCHDCDIYKAKPPQHAFMYPLCCEEEFQKVNDSCCEQFEKGIKRIWKKSL